MEHTGLLVHEDFIKGSDLDTLFVHSKLSTDETSTRCKTNIGLKSLSYTGPSLWNNLNENLKRSSSINNFKHKIKVLFRRIKKT